MSSRKKRKPVLTYDSVEVKPELPYLKWIVGGVLLIAFLVVAVGYFNFGKEQDEQADAVPTTPEDILVSLSKDKFEGVEKRVKEKLQNLVTETQASPSSAHAWGKLAMNLDIHDRKNEALICYQKASELNPDDARWPYYRAVLLYDRGSEEALKYFEQSLNLRPANLAGRIRYGQALLDSNRLEQAGREFVKALEVDKSSSHAYLGLARISMSQGQLRDCGSLLQKAIQSNPRHGEVYGLMAEVYRRLKEPQKANVQMSISQQLPKNTPLPDDLEAALVAEGESSYWYDLRGRGALERGDYRTAERELKLAVEAAPDPRYYDTLGVAYLYQKKYEDAVKAHRKALELNPKSTGSMNNLAAALFELDQKQEAMQVVQNAIAADPAMPYSYLHLARLYIRDGNRAGAIQTYRAGLEKIPQSSEIAIQLAWLLATSSEASLRNGKEAVQLAEAVASRNPSAETLDILAAAYAEAGEFTRAIQIEERALAFAEANKRTQFAERIKRHLKEFRANRPFHE